MRGECMGGCMPYTERGRSLKTDLEMRFYRVGGGILCRRILEKKALEKKVL